MITTAQTESLHRHYVSLTGMDIKFTMHWHYHYEHWLAAGFTLPDLTLVVQYLKRRIRDKRTPLESLKLSNVVGRLEKFSEDLAIAKAELRNFKPETNREKVLMATGRLENTQSPPKTPAQIMSGKSVDELVANLRKAAA